jgi:hypothetical protein
MRALLAAAMFLTLAGPAAAKPSPPHSPRLTPSPAELAIATGAAGALVESSYFHAPNARLYGHGALVCRLQSEMFSTVRLARACR